MNTHHHDHSHAYGGTVTTAPYRLLTSLLLTWAFALVEAVAGWRGGSLALLADAGHMVTDGAALGLALNANWIAARPPSARHDLKRKAAEHGIGHVTFQPETVPWASLQRHV